jgi:hypothetical protein
MKAVLMAIWEYLRSFYENGSLEQIDSLSNSPLGKAFSQGKLGQIWVIFKQLIEINRHQFYTGWLEEYVDNIVAIIAFWQRGWLGRVELLTLAAGGLMVPSVVVMNMESSEGHLPFWVLAAGLVMYALAYAFASAAISYLNYPLFILSSLYLLWYTFIIGGSLKGSPLFTLPSLWLLFTGWLMARSVEGRSKYVWLAVLCCAISYLTYGAFGIYARFKYLAAEWQMVLVFAIFYYLLTTIPLLRQQGQLPSRPGALFIFNGTLLVIGLFFVLAVFKDAQLTAEHTLLTIKCLLGWVDLFWMWLGAAVVEGALDSGDWWTETSIKLFSWQRARWLIPITWLAAAYLGWLMTLSGESSGASWFLYTSGLSDWVNTWDDSFYFTVQFQVYASIFIFILWCVATLLKRSSDKLLSLLCGIWIAVFLTYLGFYQSYQGFETLEEDARLGTDWWLAVVLVLGLVWELAQAGESYWDSDTPQRHFAVVALLGFMFSISAMTLGAGLPDLVMEYTFYSFSGIIYLGVPMMIYMISQRSGYESVERTHLIGLVALGAISAIIPLSINPWGDWSLCLAPVCWVLIIIVKGRSLARFESYWDAAIAGGALATGFVAFWMFPQAILVPFFSFFQDFQDRYLTLDLQRPLLKEGQLWFSLIAIGSGVLLALFTFIIQQRFYPKSKEIQS